MDEDKPDFDISYMDEVCTAEQKSSVARLTEAGWSASHIWEYEMGWLAVWCIIRRRPTELSRRPSFTHCYVKPSGEIVRVRPRR